MKRLISLFLLPITLSIPCLRAQSQTGQSQTACSQTEPSLYRLADGKKMAQWADSVFDAMSYDERIGQLFMIVAEPSDAKGNMRKIMQYIDSIKIGGILFSKGDPLMQAEVTNRLQGFSRAPLMIALDGEWGLSMRLSQTTRFPRNMMLGAIENDSLIALYGEEVGRQCREMGIHVNFAPSLDVNSNIENPVIGTRSFGENPQAVADKGIAYSKGLERANILSVAKHFPGHGDTSEDSHHTLPLVGHDKERLDSIELLPFKRYISEGFAAVMTAHLYVPALDKTTNLPASYSQPIVTDLLRNEYGFRGLLFTDALAMKGASDAKGGNPSVRALLAGNDVLLAPAHPLADFRAVKEAIEKGVIDLKEVEKRCLKILRYKYLAGLHHYTPVKTAGLSDRINSPHAAWLAAKLNAEGITLLKNDSDLIPVRQLDKKRIAVLSIGEGEGNTFQETLGRYAAVDRFSIGRNTPPAHQQRIYRLLEDYDLIVAGIHTVRIPQGEALLRLAAKKPMVVAFFTHPYFCRDYRLTVTRARSVIMAYENSPLAMSYAAQLVFGGIAAKGKLPVSIPGLYFAGAGIFTQKTRLGYHEAEEVGLSASRLAAIDSIATEGLAAGAYPGCRVLVARDGMIVYDKAFGHHDYTRTQKVTKAAVYDLASVTKAAATLPLVMKMFDDGAFTLTSKTGDFIPSLAGSGKESLTVEDLLYHRTGLVPTLSIRARTHYESPIEGFGTEAAKAFYISDNYRDTLMQAIKASRLGQKGKYVYSCINFVMLQRMIEHHSRQTIDTLFATHFSRRLGATTLTYNPLKTIDTFLIAPTENDTIFRHQLLRGYVHDEVAALGGGVSGNAGLFASAGDLAKMLQLYLNHGVYGGERYLSDSTVTLFTTLKSDNSHRGLGFDKPIPANPKASPADHPAPAVYGHTGYTGTCFWVDPSNQLIYIFLSNRVNPTRANNRLSSLNIRTRIQNATRPVGRLY
ncbi:MAG: serine hydrolase [Tannerellaceae bacterium]|jgi:beta-glucosidase-like glycosyl hydrolase/CubicO group peptidase (beta-lactamase class C family)|nr:serine hydrolase [Tannerellaceae bacterium]